MGHETSTLPDTASDATRTGRVVLLEKTRPAHSHTGGIRFTLVYDSIQSGAVWRETACGGRGRAGHAGEPDIRLQTFSRMDEPRKGHTEAAGEHA